MPTRPPFGIGEWYHCYNRGVDKRRTFMSDAEYRRFQMLMLICNSDDAAHTGNLRGRTFADIASRATAHTDTLVSIGAYALMPNHFHFVLYEKSDGGISRFMQKLMTGYTMFFNQRHERTGALFAGSFKSKHIPTDRYFKHLVSYIHLNPAELFDPRWKDGTRMPGKVSEALRTYPYSSLTDFLGDVRPENILLGQEVQSLYDSKQSLEKTVEQARGYYASLNEV